MLEALEEHLGGNYAAAHARLQAALDTLNIDETETRSELLSFDADLSAEAGCTATAMSLYTQALTLTADTYRRYSIQLSLGALFEKVDERSTASEWYIVAIRTALSVDGISAGSALQRFLAIKRGNLTQNELTLCEEAVRHSWSALHLAAQPDVSDLAGSIQTLIESAGREPHDSV
jgi:hypothetical protein